MFPIYDDEGKYSKTITLKEYEKIIRDKTILDLIYKFEESIHDIWRTSEIVDFLQEFSMEKK